MDGISPISLLSGWFSEENLSNLPETIASDDPAYPFAGVCEVCGTICLFTEDPWADGEDPDLGCDTCGNPGSILDARTYPDELAELREMAAELAELDDEDPEA